MEFWLFTCSCSSIMKNILRWDFVAKWDSTSFLSSQQIDASNFYNIKTEHSINYFDKILGLGIVGQRDPKTGQKWGFLVSWQVDVWDVTNFSIVVLCLSLDFGGEKRYSAKLCFHPCTAASIDDLLRFFIGHWSIMFV